MTALARQLKAHPSPKSRCTFEVQPANARRTRVTDLETRSRLVRESGPLRWIEQLTQKAQRDLQTRQREAQQRCSEIRRQLNARKQVDQPSPASLVDQIDAYHQRIQQAQSRHLIKQEEFRKRRLELTKTMHAHFADVLRDKAKVRAKLRRFLLVCEELLQDDLSRSRRRNLVKEQIRLRGVLSRVKVGRGQFRLSMDASNLTKNDAREAEAARQAKAYIRSLQNRIEETQQRLCNIYEKLDRPEIEAYRAAKTAVGSMCPQTLLQQSEKRLAQARERSQRAKLIEHWSLG